MSLNWEKMESFTISFWASSNGWLWASLRPKKKVRTSITMKKSLFSLLKRLNSSSTKYLLWFDLIAILRWFCKNKYQICHLLRLEWRVEVFKCFCRVFWKHLQEHDRERLCWRFVLEDDLEARSREFWDILGTKGVIYYLILFWVFSKWVFLCISYCSNL